MPINSIKMLCITMTINSSSLCKILFTKAICANLWLFWGLKLVTLCCTALFGLFYSEKLGCFKKQNQLGIPSVSNMQLETRKTKGCRAKFSKPRKRFWILSSRLRLLDHILTQRTPFNLNSNCASWSTSCLKSLQSCLTVCHVSITTDFRIIHDKQHVIKQKELNLPWAWMGFT